MTSTRETVHSSWLPWSSLEVVLTGADLRAFETLAGMEGVQLKHPAQFEFRVARDSRSAALEFVSELELALADHALRVAEDAQLQFGARAPLVLERPKAT